MADITIKLIIILVLLVCGIQDILKKKILLWSILLGAVFIGICIPFSSSYTILDRFGGISVGITIITLSIATAGKIGLGDGLLLCITGMGMGFWDNLELFAVALFLAALVSIALLIFRLADRKKSIPFVPFLLIGYVFVLI